MAKVLAVEDEPTTGVLVQRGPGISLGVCWSPAQTWSSRV